MQILLHTRTASEFDWQKKPITLSRLPATGEYISVQGDGNEAMWHEVRLVVHVAGAREIEAEIYCNRIGPTVMRRLAWTSTLRQSETTLPTVAQSDEPSSSSLVFLTEEQAAQVAGVDKQTIRRLIEKGRLKATDFGTGKRQFYRIAPEDLMAVTPRLQDESLQPQEAIAPPTRRRRRVRQPSASLPYQSIRLRSV